MRGQKSSEGSTHMKGKIFISALTSIALAAIAVPAIAHHSFSAEFHQDKRITIAGVITNVKWQNPHVYFYVDVTDPATKRVTTYAVEMGSPNGVLGGGLSRNSLKVGTVVNIPDAALAKDGSPKVNARTVLVDGKAFNAASSEGLTP
jgi:hypothetical protein